MWTLKHEIISQILYDLLIKKEFKNDTHLDLNNLYSHIKMSLNEVIKIQEDLIPYWQSIKRHYFFQ